MSACMPPRQQRANALTRFRILRGDEPISNTTSQKLHACGRSTFCSCVYQLEPTRRASQSVANTRCPLRRSARSGMGGARHMGLPPPSSWCLHDSIVAEGAEIRLISASPLLLNARMARSLQPDCAERSLDRRECHRQPERCWDSWRFSPPPSSPDDSSLRQWRCRSTIPSMRTSSSSSLASPPWRMRKTAH
jgi:hypothetical protein